MDKIVQFQVVDDQDSTIIYAPCVDGSMWFCHFVPGPAKWSKLDIPVIGVDDAS